MNFPTGIKITITVFFILVLINLCYLDFTFLKDKKEANLILNTKPTGTSISDNPVSSESACLNDCQKIIDETIGNINSTNIDIPVENTTPIKTKTVEREFSISFGSSTSKTSNWEDLLGVEAYIDNTKYGNIKQALFEASISIPNGNQTAYVRLFNVTDKHPVWFSEISIEGGTPRLLISSPIKLDDGNKLYRVQMKTSLSDSANLIQSRLKITSYIEE